MPTNNLHTTTQNRKIDEIESLRGLAALLVVIFHILPWNSKFDIRFIQNGYLMVYLFFVLSGFVIYNAYANKITTRNELIRFQFLRFGRLYPVHILFLAVALFLEFVKYFAHTKFGFASPNSQPFIENNFTAFFQQIFLLQAIGPTGHETTFNGPAWSISVEFYTYFIFGVVSLTCQKFKDYIYILIFIVSLLLILSSTTFGSTSLLLCLSGFFLGCITARSEQTFKIAVPPFTSFMIFTIMILFLSYKTNVQYDPIIYLLTALLIFTIVSTRNGLLNKLLNLKPFVWLGTISYSLYMCHEPVEWTINQLIRVILKPQEVLINGKSIPQLSFVETAIAYVFILVTVLCIGNLVYQKVEKPWREKSRRVII